MQDSIYGYMKLGIVHFKAYPQCMGGQGPIYDTMAKIAEDDFWTAVEMGPVKDERERDRVRKMLEVSHLDIAYATQPTMLPQKLNPHAFDAEERKRVLMIIKKCADEAYQLGASFFRVMSGKDPGDDKRDDAMKYFQDFLHEVCDYVKANGDMKVTLKIFDRAVDKKALVGPFADAAAVARPVADAHDNFGLLSDLSHFALLDEKPEEALPLIKDFFCHFHIGNCVVKDPKHFLYGDLQPRFGVPGGEVDTPQVRDYFRLLLDLGMFDKENPPFLSTEVRPLLAEESSELVLANAKRVIKQAWAQA